MAGRLSLNQPQLFVMSESLLKPFVRQLRSVFRTEQSYDVCHIEEVEAISEPVTLMEGQSVATPETANMHLDPFAAYVKGPEYWTPTVTTSSLERVLFCPVNNCIMRNDRVVVSESTGPGARAIGLNSRALQNSRIETCKGVWTALRCPFNDFYHFLVDNLSRFDLLHDPEFAQYDTINVFCPGGLSDLEHYFLSRLCPQNVQLVPVSKDRVYQPEIYLFNSFVTKRASGFVREPFLSRVQRRIIGRDKGSTARILISRARSSSRRIRNEAQLVQALKTLGFEKYTLEEMSPHDQVDLFAQAEFVVAPHGAGLANLLFSSQTAVVELFGSSFVVPHYYLLCKAMGHPYQYICGYSADRDADIRVEVDHVLHLVNRHLDPEGSKAEGAPGLTHQHTSPAPTNL